MKFLFALALVSACMIDTASAQTACGERDDFVKQIAEGWHEARVAAAVTRRGALLEVFASKEGTWSILMTLPGDKTCIVEAGDQGWQIEPLKGVEL